MTPNDLLNSIMSYASQYGVSGIKTGNTSSGFMALIPQFCNDVQEEIIIECNISTRYDETLSALSGEGYRAVALPSNFMQLKKLLDVDESNYVDDASFAYIDGTDLQVNNSFSGVLSIYYLANTTITSLDDTFIISDIFRLAIIWYNVAQLLFNSNSDKAGFAQAKYEEVIRKLKKKDVKKLKPIKNVY